MNRQKQWEEKITLTHVNHNRFTVQINDNNRGIKTTQTQILGNNNMKNWGSMIRIKAFYCIQEEDGKND